MWPRLLTLPAFDLFGRHVGPLTLYSYGVLLAAAFLAGLWVAGRQARREGLKQERVTDLAVYLLPLSGLFMSVLYPTLNSKGISCFPRSEHGAVAGVILFFTAFAAAVGPLAMGAISDALGDIKYGFVLATGFAALLFAGLLINRVFDPAGARLARRDDSDYAAAH